MRQLYSSSTMQKTFLYLECVNIGHGYWCCLFKTDGWDGHFRIFKKWCSNYSSKHTLMQFDLMTVSITISISAFSIPLTVPEVREELFSELGFNSMPVHLTVF